MKGEMLTPDNYEDYATVVQPAAVASASSKTGRNASPVITVTNKRTDAPVFVQTDADYLLERTRQACDGNVRWSLRDIQTVRRMVERRESK